MRLLFTILLFTVLQFVVNLKSAAQTVNPEVVAKKLLEKIAEEPEAYYSIHIVLADKVDLATLDAELSASRASAGTRSEAVLTALQAKAAETQGELLAFLKNSPFVEQETVHSYWIANAIFAHVKKEMVAELSRRSDVAWIGLNGKLELDKFEKAPPPPFEPNGIEPGLAAINAPAMWAMGYTGYGQVAFTNDTGIDPSHPAIATRYRGLYVPQEHTWFEVDTTLQPTGNFVPHDCDAHGTHVTGTILGLDRLNNDTVGVAFNAQWIGAAILCGIGTEDNVAAFQWSLDPDGIPASVDDMPDIINNSWYDPSLDTVDCFSVYVPVLEAMEAAGIAVIFSAGNFGPGDMSITPPHNININELNSFTVGALNANVANLLIASFSSRGPSHCGGDSSLLIKPEVSAPGVSVRSCIPGNQYDFYNGTSMASPHVSGAILLLKEAFPNITGKQLKEAIYLTCTDLGVPGEDNTFGMGIINVLEAFNYLVAQGHVPVSPYVANDVMLVDIGLAPISCENEVVPQIIVENAGTDTVFSFDAVYVAGAFSTSFTWTGVLAPKERASIMLPPMTVAPGDFELELTLENPNGVPDERPLNNRFRRLTKAIDRERFQAHVEGGDPAAVCENTPALLRGEYHGPGKVDVTWFDEPFGGSSLGQGETFVTPPLASPQTFYADALYTVPVGLENRNAGPGAYLDTSGLGMVFNVYHQTVLKSVKVYAEKTGARLFELYDPEGNTLYTSVKTVGDTGEVRIEFNWNIPPGAGYQFIKKGGKPFYANFSGADYPYKIDGIAEITGTADGVDGACYYFYDWEFEFREPCGRTAVPVDVMPAGSSPNAIFSTSADSLTLPNEATVNFTNNSTDNIAAFHWNFGDGTTSSEEHASHTYSVPGVYVVSLSVVSLDGCTDFALDTITVAEEPLSGLKPIPSAFDGIAVFPNPVRDIFTVHFDLTTPQPVTLRLADLTGRLVKTADYPSVQSDALTLDAGDLPTGVYLLLVETEGKKTVWKVVKI